MNEQRLNKAVKQMDEAFAETFRQTMNNTPPPNLRINLKDRRWATFWQLQKSAFQMLFTGKTSIFVRKH